MEINDISAFSGAPLLRASESAIKHNARIKLYPDGCAEIMCATRNIFREAGYEEVDPRDAHPREADPREADPDKEGNLARAQRRARNMVADYIRASGLDWFCTFTLDPAKVDRYDPEACFKKLHNWLDNAVRRKGTTYVLVPEYHKDGAVHFHACLDPGTLSLVDSGTIDRHEGGKPRKPRTAAQRREWLDAGGSIVYNVTDWRFGFSTAIQMYGDRARAINYVTKYISKSDDKIGGRWYYSGGDLRLPSVRCFNCDFEAVLDSLKDHRGGAWEIPDLDCSAAKVSLEGGELHDYIQTVAR